MLANANLNILFYINNVKKALQMKKLMRPPVKSHRISRQSFLVNPPDLRLWVTVAFWTSLPMTGLPAIITSYQLSVRQATISISLLLDCTPHDANPGSPLCDSSATTPLVDFYHRL